MKFRPFNWALLCADLAANLETSVWLSQPVQCRKMATLTPIELALTKHEIFLRPQPASGA